MRFLHANDAKSSLANSLSTGSTSLILASGTGSKFPSPVLGEAFNLTIIDSVTGLVKEIVMCTSRTGDVCTVVRGQEGTTAQNWNAGDLVANYITALALENLNSQSASLIGGPEQVYRNGIDYTAGTSTTIVIAAGFSNINDYDVFFGGIRQSRGTFSYNPSTRTITFSSPIPSGQSAIYVVPQGGTASVESVDLVTQVHGVLPVQYGGTGTTTGVVGNAPITFQDEGTALGTTGTVDTVNLTGDALSATRSGNTVTINSSKSIVSTNITDSSAVGRAVLVAGSTAAARSAIAANAAIQFQDEATNIGTAGAETTVNFAGAGVTATESSGTVTVTIPSWQPKLQFQNSGSNIGTSGGESSINFTGAGVTAAESGGAVTVTIPGGGGTAYTGTKNFIDNGNFDIWQRGTSFSATGYTADRCYLTAASGTTALTQVALAAGTVPAGGSTRPTYALSWAITSAVAATNYIEWRMEGVRRSSGRTFTLSFSASGTNGAVYSVEVEQRFGTGGSTSVVSTAQTFTNTTSGAKVSLTFTFASVSGKTIGANDCFIARVKAPTGTNTLQLSEVQFEIGSASTAYEEMPISTTLMRCQRFYEIGGTSSDHIWSGQVTSGVSYYLGWAYAVTKRALPAMTYVNFAASNFPATINGTVGGLYGHREERVASATATSAYFISTWGADAEIY